MDVNPKVEDIINLLNNPSKKDIELITKAFEFAQKAHKGQKRFSGEPYFIHPFETAKTLAQTQLDAKAIVAGLLHDVCEDTNIAPQELEKEFGEEIAFLVSGVTKLGKLKYSGTERRVESLRKMFLAMAKDIRVVLIRLADRLHNMQTLQYVRPEKQKRIALETLEIYAPLANRLGMGGIKGQLEDLAFPYAYPNKYKEIKELSKEKYEKRERELAKIKYALKQKLEKNKIKDFEINSRVKHLYSLYKKLQEPEKGNNINNVYDLIAIRIIVKTIEDCYKIMGIIHGTWKPLPGRIKDMISFPKPNGYQSLHTTVIAENGTIVEIQIRTEKMHQEAQYGIAAHWAYEETRKHMNDKKIGKNFSWINQLAQWQKETPKSEEFLEALRLDFFEDRVFCFTPKGEVIDLPKDATVIDFAYAIHTDIGNHAIGATVNEKYVSLETILRNGDIVKIKTQKNKKPSRGWIKHAKTSFAKKQIRSAIKNSSFFEGFNFGN